MLPHLLLVLLPLALAAPNESSNDLTIMDEVEAPPFGNEQRALQLEKAMLNSAQVSLDKLESHDSNDEPMVYEIPVDYAAHAREERERLIAEGASPDSVIFQTEVGKFVAPKKEDESPENYARRYVETMNDMIDRGVTVLNDICTGDTVASGFGLEDGRYFDLGPGSGATKGEFRDFSKWFERVWDGEDFGEVPERFLKFEKPEPDAYVGGVDDATKV